MDATATTPLFPPPTTGIPQNPKASSERTWTPIQNCTKEKKLRICRDLNYLLSEKEGKPIAEVVGKIHNPTLIDTTKRFLREHKKQLFNEPDYQTLRRRFVAVRNGLRTSDLQGKDDFIDFATKNYLHRYLLHFKHSLKVDPANKEIMILYKGKYQKWSEVKKTISLTEDGTLKGQYCQDGIINEDRFSWEKLKPYKWEDPAAWNYQYLYEHCLWTHPKLQLQDNHSWVRLRTPEGLVYSVGEWPKDKGRAYSWIKFPLRLKKARLMSPEVSEFWGGVPIESLAIAITKKQFEQMLDRINKDKINPKRAYHMLHRNCTSYANRIGKMAGLKDQGALPITKLFVPNPIYHFSAKFYNLLPTPVKKVTEVTTAVSIRIFTAMMGYWTFGNPKAEHIPKQRGPHLPSLNELAKVPTIDHPHPTLYNVIKQIKEWRIAEKDRLEKKAVKITHQLVSENVTITEKATLGKQLLEIESKMSQVKYALPPTRVNKRTNLT